MSFSTIPNQLAPFPSVRAILLRPLVRYCRFHLTISRLGGTFSMATARPPPPLLPGLLGGNKAQGLKKRGANRNQRTVPEVAKAVLRYMKGRRTEIVEMEDQAADNVKGALETINRHMLEWEALAKSGGGSDGSKRKFKLVQVEDHSWSFVHDLAVSIPCDDFNALDWKTATSIGKSNEGTEGVYFVGFPSHRSLVVKAPSSIGAEIYGTVLAKRLGVATPCLRVVSRNSSEGQGIMAALVALDKRVEKGLGRPFFFIMEYVKGVVLGDVIGETPGHAGEGTRWTGDKFGEPPETFHGIGEENLVQLGKMVGLDFITNNFDRFPVVWANNGNPENMMFYGGAPDIEDGRRHRMVAIDNMTSCISKEKYEKEYTAYKAKATSVLSELFSNPDKANEAFARVRKFLKSGVPNGGWPGLSVDIGDKGVMLIQQGFLESLAAIGDMEKNELHELKDAIHDLLKESLTENFTYGLERVDPEFIVDIATAMYDAVATDLDNLASDGAAEEDGGSGDVGGEDEFSQPSIQPDPALVPGTGDVEHRLLVERQRQEEDLRHINRILGAKVLWGKPFRRTVVEEASPAAGSSTRPERFVSPRARRGIQRRRQQESGVCSIQ